jgi:hypothetical protein
MCKFVKVLMRRHTRLKGNCTTSLAKALVPNLRIRVNGKMLIRGHNNNRTMNSYAFKDPSVTNPDAGSARGPRFVLFSSSSWRACDGVIITDNPTWRFGKIAPAPDFSGSRLETGSG